MENGSVIVYAYMEERFEKIGVCVTPPLKTKLNLGWNNHFDNQFCFRVNVKLNRRDFARIFGKKPKYTYKTNKRRRA